MFNPKSRSISTIPTIPAAWRVIFLALGAALVAYLALQTLTAISAHDPDSLTVGLTPTQESAGFPELEANPVVSSLLPSIGQPPAWSLTNAYLGTRGEGAEEDFPVRLLAVGPGGNETIGEPTKTLTARQSRKALGGPPSTELAPLLNADNLIRVFHFKNSTKDWLFYDPRPAFTAANTIIDLENRKIYWLKVKRDQDVTLNGKPQRVSCTNEGTAYEDCWNILVW